MHSSGPRLKNGVDLQLQSAFYDQNWSTVVRLAEKRAKMSNDSYYEVRHIRWNRFACSYLHNLRFIIDAIFF